MTIVTWWFGGGFAAANLEAVLKFTLNLDK